MFVGVCKCSCLCVRFVGVCRCFLKLIVPRKHNHEEIDQQGGIYTRNFTTTEVVVCLQEIIMGTM